MLWLLLGLVALVSAWVGVTQGAFLGARFVRWFYDQGARIYDETKNNTPEEDRAFLGEPIGPRLPPAARVLDVATGTGRVPMALLAVPGFHGRIVGLDASAPMLAKAAPKLRPWRRVDLVRGEALPLPFRDATFDAVTAVEALELLPDPWASLAEMIRVLKPGGLLAITNRSGLAALVMPGRVVGHAKLLARLGALGLTEIALGRRHGYGGREFFTLVMGTKR